MDGRDKRAERLPVPGRLMRFLASGIWRIRARDLSRLRALWVRPLRVGLLAVRGFQKDQCMFRASALTFYSLLSIVPVLAMAFGLSKGFGLERALEKELFQRFQGQEEVVVWLMSFTRSLLESAKGGVIAGVGILLLLWTIIRVLGTIENAFNHIWGIQRPRSLARKISDYLSTMLIGPLLLVLSSAATVLIKGQIELVVRKIELLGPLGLGIFLALEILPYAVIWILFSFVYVSMPNTRVRLTSAVIAGVIAGTLYQGFQLAYLSFQIGVSRYNAIYGSFSALPLFLVWLQISWVILLFGAEISFAHQNEEDFEFEPDCRSVSAAFKRLLTLRIVHCLVKNFAQGSPPASAGLIAHRLEIPIRLVRRILGELTLAGVVSEICDNGQRETTYQPAQDIDLFTIKWVVDRLERQGSEDIPVVQSEELTRLSECLKAFGDLIEGAKANVLLKDI